MSMYVGVQLEAPDGFESLESGKIYHLFVNDVRRDRVLLVEFVERTSRCAANEKRRKHRTPNPLPVLQAIRRLRFEQALLDGKIRRLEPQFDLPPWLGGLTSMQLSAHDARRRPGAIRHDQRIDRILGHIEPLLERLDDVVTADDPFTEINRHAANCRPKQNPSRLRWWFLTYLLYGRNRWALHYPIHNIGRWDRMSKSGQKFGRRSAIRGADHGFGSNDPEMIAKAEEGYRKFAGPGVHLGTIYRKTLTMIFGCKAVRDGFGGRRFVHPDGLPFPTYDQFIYRVDKAFPLRERQLTKYGQARTRNRLSAPKGTFQESVGSLLERVEGDGYVVKEIAVGFLAEAHLPRLVVVRIRCVASGMLVGIGFSVGGEKASAYRMAKFSMAIDKVRFCRYFGLHIRPDDWPCLGLSPHEIVDRGPGMTASARSRGDTGSPVISESSPSYMGQSKAIIESSNPRAVKPEGAPTIVTTKMTLPQLAKREINRTIAANRSTDATARLNNNAIVAGVRHTPIDLWNYLQERARTCAVPMVFEDAVRAFLTPIALTAKPTGVYFRNQRFDSDALRRTGLHERMVSGQSVELKGFMLDVCVCFLWVEVGADLVEVEAQLTIADSDEQLYISVNELEQIAELRKRGRRELLAHSAAETAYWEQQFLEETGVAVDQGTRRKGRHRRNKAASVRERQETAPYLDGRRRSK